MNLLNALAITVFCAAILASPWPIGGNFPYVRTVCMALAAGLSLLAAVKTLASPERQRFSWSWLLIVLGTAYAIFQAYPGSRSILETAGLSLPTNYVSAEPLDSLSAYPAATRERVIELFAGVGFFFAACCFLYHRKAVQCVMYTAACVGVVLGFVGIIQNLSWNGKVLWFYELNMGGLPFGPFVNKNNAGGFLLACYAAAMFVVSRQMITWRPYGRVNEVDRQFFGEKKPSALRSFANIIASLQTKHLYSITGMIFIASAIVATLSRGAAAALLVASVISFAILSSVNRWVLALMLLIAIGAGGLMIYSEQTESVVTQAETMADLSSAAAPRLQHWNDALPYVKENYVLGSGPGTYPYLYLETQSRHFEHWFKHAENIYLETLAEMGLPGIVALLLTLLVCLLSSWRLFHTSNDEFDRSLGVAGVCLLVGQGIACFFDFGLYHPPNMIIVATMTGCIVGRATYIAAEANKQYLFPMLLRTICLIAIGVGCCFGFLESRGVEALANAKRLLISFDASSGRKVEILDQVESELEVAKSIRPDDSELQFQLGEYQIARFRVQEVERILEEARIEMERRPQTSIETTEASNSNTTVPQRSSSQSNSRAQEDAPDGSGEVDFINTYEEAWPLTSLSALHRMLHFSRRLNPQEYQKILASDAESQYLSKAWDCYKAAEDACDSLPKTRFRLAQLSIANDSGQSEWSHIEKAIERMPTDSQLLYDCGLLALSAGKADETTRMWAQSLEYTRRHEQAIVEFGRRELPMKQFFEKVLPQDPKELLRIAKKYFGEIQETLSQRCSSCILDA